MVFPGISIRYSLVNTAMPNVSPQTTTRFLKLRGSNLFSYDLNNPTATPPIVRGWPMATPASLDETWRTGPVAAGLGY